jgi:hypothetical protein
MLRMRCRIKEEGGVSSKQRQALENLINCEKRVKMMYNEDCGL